MFLALIAVLIVWWFIGTRVWLGVRAAGEAPEAADTAGVSVVRTRYAAVLISGAMCGVAGCCCCSRAQGNLLRI